MSTCPRSAILLTLLLSTTALAAQEAAENVSEITVTSPKSNDRVTRQISIVGEVEFAQTPADIWAVFVFILAPDSNYYFSTWEGEINYEILRIKDVGGKPVAEWKLDNLFFGRPSTADTGKSFDFFIVALKESEIQGIVKRICPRLKETDSCVGTRTDYRNLLRKDLAPSASVSDRVTVTRE